MDEGVVAAAARAIKFIGEAALRSTAANLVTHGHQVASGLAHIGAGLEAPRQILALACDELALSLDETKVRSEAVSVLFKAAADLEGALGVELVSIREEAASIARVCTEHQSAVAEMEKVRIAEAERERIAEAEREKRTVIRWWHRIWPFRRYCVEDGIHGSLLTTVVPDQLNIAVNLLAKEAATAPQLKHLAQTFIASVHQLQNANAELVGHVKSIEEAAGALQEGGNLMDLIINISKAATAVEEALGAQITTLRGPVTMLSQACQEYHDGEEAMIAIQRAATAQSQPQHSEGAIVHSRPQVPSRLGKEALAEKTTGCHGYGMYGSLSMLPSFGTNTPLKNSSVFTVIFCSWWSIVAMGIPSSLFPWTTLDVTFAHLTSRISLIGINILVVLYTSWMLGTNTLVVLGFLLALVIGGHLFFIIWQYYKARDARGRGSSPDV